MTKKQITDYPHNLDMEREILSTIILKDESVLDRYIDKINPKWFYRDSHKTIYRVCVNLWKEKVPIEPISIKQYCKENKISYNFDDLMKILDALGSAELLVYAIAKVKELYIKREIIKMSLWIQMNTKNQSIDSLLSEINEKLGKITDAVLGNEDEKKYTVADILLEKAENVGKEKKEWTIKTGITRLDNATKGLKKKRLVVIGGDPGMGKTTLVSNIVYEAARHGIKTLFFSLDESSDSLSNKFAAISTGMSLDVLEGNFGGGKDMDSFNKYLKKLLSQTPSLKNIHIRDTRFDVLKIESEIKNMVRSDGIELVIVDYASIVEIEDTKVETQAQAQQKVIQRLKRVGREEDVVMIVLSQLTKQGDVPTLRSLFGTREMSAAPDLVLATHRETKQSDYVVGENLIEDIKILILKGKNTPDGCVLARWIKDKAIITNPTSEEYVPFGEITVNN